MRYSVLILILGLTLSLLVTTVGAQEEEFGISDFDAANKKNTTTTVPSSEPNKLSPPKSEQPEKVNGSNESKGELRVKQTVTPDTSHAPEASSDAGEGAGAVRFAEGRTTRFITLSGALGGGFVFRDDFFADAATGNQTTDFDEDFFDPRAMVKVVVQMENNIRGILELQHETRTGILHRTSLGTHYISNRSTENEFRFELEKIYLAINDFLVPRLSLESGVIPFKRALRPNGQAFFLDFGEAESPFATRPDTHAAGAVARYQPYRELQFYTEAFYFVTAESRFRRRDETVTGINLDLNLSKEIRGEDQSRTMLTRFFNLIFAAIQGDNHSPIWSFGGGFMYMFTADPQSYLVELYGEVLFQFGAYHRKYQPPAYALQDQHHLALGGYGGFRFTNTSNRWKPYIDVSAWYVSGDDDDPNANTNHDLVTYESINSTLIMEENDYGLDVDSNYWAVKIQGGISLFPLAGEELRLDILYAHFETIDSPPHRTHRLGEEIDVRLLWEYTSDLKFSVATGVLWDSQYFEEVFTEIGAKGREHAFILRIEAMLRF